MRPPKNVRITLAGGIGNQLFQYAAASKVASNLGANLVVNAMASQFGRTGHSDWIDRLGLPGTFISSKTAKSPAYATHLVRTRLRGLGLRVFARKSILSAFGTQHLRSTVLGYDPELELLQGNVEISGYFQTYKHVDQVRSIVSQRVSEYFPDSLWYQSNLKIFQEKKILVLHVRRGDYANAADSFGLLGEDYYLEAIQKLKEKGLHWQEIWVFSDDIRRVKAEFRSSVSRSWVYVTAPTGSHSLETLLLMSRGEGIVIGNSTFSFWAAALSNAKNIVRPSKWFKSMEDPADLHPPEWLTAESSWLGGGYSAD